MQHAALIAAVLALSAAAVADPDRPPRPAVSARDEGRYDEGRYDEHRHHAHQPRGHDGLERGCAVDVDDAFAELDAALRALAADADRVRGRAGRAVRNDIDQVFAAAAAARERACRAAARPGPPVVVAPPAPAVLDRGAAERLERALHAEAFDQGRLRVLSTALRGDVCVSSQQTRSLLSAWAFSGGRADALEVLAPHLVDDGEAYIIVAALPFEGDKRAAHRILERTPVLPACRGFR
jgi:hypothetical protein